MTELLFNDTYTGPRFTYGFKYRPPGYATCPKGYIVGSNKEHPDFRNFGTIDYPHELTEEEVRQFELVQVFERDPGHQYAALLDAFEAAMESLRKSGYKPGNPTEAGADLVNALEAWSEKHLKRIR